MLDLFGPFTLIIYFLIGLLIGCKVFPSKFLKVNSLIQLICLSIILFSLGLSLGSEERFLSQIKDVGIEAFFYAVLAILGSVGVVYLFTRCFLKGSKK